MPHFLPLLLSVSVLAVVATLLSPAANAAAPRTFVASYGLTANTAFNCSIAKPCRAFTEAIGVTNAGGEVIVLDSAGYGSVTITKAVSIIAPAGIYAGISVSSGNDGVTVNAPGAIVVLRGLSINGQGGNRGIIVLAAARVRIESCVVSGMGISGIRHGAAGAEMIVLDTIVRDNVGSGIVVNGDLPSAVLDHVRSEHNGGDGLSVIPTAGSAGTFATVVNSVFAHNEGKGIGAGTVSGSTITIVVERSAMSNNGQGGFTAVGTGGSAVATLTRNTINDNGGHGIFVHNGKGAAYENAIHRNNGDGIRVEGFAIFYASANTGSTNLGYDLSCDAAPAQLRALANNVVDVVNGLGICLTSHSGWGI